MIIKSKILLTILTILLCVLNVSLVNSYDVYDTNKRRIEGINSYKARLDNYMYDKPFLPYYLSYYYENESVREKISYIGDAYLVLNDLKNSLEITVKPFKHMYYIDENNKVIITEGYDIKFPLKEEKTRTGSFKIVKENIYAGSKKPMTVEKRAEIDKSSKIRKFADVYILDEGGVPFKTGYYYEVELVFNVKEGVQISKTEKFNVLEAKTRIEKKNWYNRRIRASLYEQDYESVIKYYNEALNNNYKTLFGGSALLKVYYKLKDFTKAREYVDKVYGREKNLEEKYNRVKEWYEKDKKKYYGYLRKEEQEEIKKTGKDLTIDEYVEKRSNYLKGDFFRKLPDVRLLQIVTGRKERLEWIKKIEESRKQLEDEDKQK